MSDTNSHGYFSIIPSRACRDKRMTLRTLQLLNLLGAYTSAKKDGWCWAKRETLAEELGLKSATGISYHIKRLEEWGYIEVYEQYREDGGRMFNAYRVLYDSLLPADADTNPPSSIDLTGGGQVQTRRGGSSPDSTGGVKSRLDGGGSSIDSTALKATKGKATRMADLNGRADDTSPVSVPQGNAPWEVADRWAHTPEGRRYIQAHNVDTTKIRNVTEAWARATGGVS